MAKDLFVNFGINSKTGTLAISLAHDTKVNSKSYCRTMLMSDRKAIPTEQQFSNVEPRNASATVTEIITSIRDRIHPGDYSKVEVYSDVNLIGEVLVTPIFLTTDIQRIFPEKPVKMTLFSGTPTTIDAAKDIFLNESNRKLLGEDPAFVSINLLVKGAKESTPIYPLPPAPAPVITTASPRDGSSTPTISTPSSSSEPGTPSPTSSTESELPSPPSTGSGSPPPPPTREADASQSMKKDLKELREEGNPSPEEDGTPKMR
jgi:hypothetical protein